MCKRTNGNKIGKPWKEFEMLVSRVEEFLCPKGAKVKSPDHLPDLETGTLREVDASIKFTVGSTPVLIVLECRDRSKKQDVLWIEQLCSKKRNLGISVIIAVSSIGFTPEAQRKGRSLGVQLRKLNKITTDNILDLLTLNIGYRGYITKNCQFEFYDDVDDRAIEFYQNDGKISIRNDKIVYSERGLEPVSTFDIFLQYYNQASENNRFSNVPVPENGESETMFLTIPFIERNFHFLFDGTKIYLKEMTVEFVHYDKRVSMKADENFVYLDGQSDEKLADLHGFKDTNSTALFSKFSLKQDLSTDKYSLTAIKADGSELDITGEEEGPKISAN